MPINEQEQFAHFDKVGEDVVRFNITGWQGEVQQAAFTWLKIKTEERERQRIAEVAEQTRLSRSNEKSAHIANGIAVLALVVAIIALIRSH